MQRLALAAFLVAVVLAAVFVATTTPLLPDPVASHFGVGGRPNGWMPRGVYVVLWLVLACVVPGAAVAAITLFARRAPRLINMPKRDYWFAPERRETTIDWLTSSALWLGTLVAAFMAGVHWMILSANLAQPTMLPQAAFWIVLGVFFAAIGLWTALFYARFRKPRENP